MINNKLFRGFTFDGVNSLGYDIYITGAGVYNAPVRAVEKVSVPGRNGDLTIDQGRFENVPVTYAKCGCAATTQEEFAEKVAAFRNALCSRVGYKRLTDDYNKDEYRMAMYVSGLEVEAIAQHRMGTFDIVFDANPQRFLYAGESPQLLVQGMTPKNPQTESGAIVSIEGTGVDKVTSLVAQITPKQAGSGDPSPSNVRPISGFDTVNIKQCASLLKPSAARTETINGITFQSFGDGSYRISGTSTAIANSTIMPIEQFVFPSDSAYSIYLNNDTATADVSVYFFDGTSRINFWSCTYENRRIVLPQPSMNGRNCNGIRLYVKAGVTIDMKLAPMVSKAPTTTHVPLGQTVYGGEVDVVTGVLTVTAVGHEFDGTETITRFGSSGKYAFRYSLGSDNLVTTEPRACSHAVNAAITTSNNNIGYYAYTVGGAGVMQWRFEDYVTSSVGDFKAWLTSQKNSGKPLVAWATLATPQTYNLTAQQVELLTGDNNVWADTGDITITWGDDPYMLINPTLHASKPLLKVTGRGTLSVGDVTMTITGTASQVLYIDCDIMETYSIQDGAMTPQNSLVTIDGYDYPVLLPGATKVTLGSGITKVEVTPRWWRV